MENKIPDPGDMDPQDPLLQQKASNNQVPPLPNTGVVMPGNNTQPIAQPTMSSGRPMPGMNPFSNGTGSGRPNIAETDANNLNQFKQGVGINQNYGYGASGKKSQAKKDAKKETAPADASTFFTSGASQPTVLAGMGIKQSIKDKRNPSDASKFTPK
tara:strand:- start:396 stop:866 length:471 start_codon:yes stop_codon:yes gene_type:complete